MKTTKFDNRGEWLAARRGKITGSRLKDIVVKRGTEKKIGFFEVIAERLSTDPYGIVMNETPMERGTRLEPEAMERFVEDTKKEVDTSLVLWERDDNQGIAISPDGFIGATEAVECKALSSARHIEACVKKFFWKRSDVDSIPDEYLMQAIQYFIVNDTLATLYMVFYDPRMITKDYFYLTINRADVQKEVEEYLAYERKEITELEQVINFFSF